MGRKRRMYMLAAGLMLLAACSRPSPAQDERAAAPAPSSSDPAVGYPTGLAEAVRRCCPDFHLPRQDEVHGKWQDSTGAGSVPFLIEGDFNGDGAKDAAVLLVAANRAGVALAIFERAGQNYRLAHRRALDRFGDVVIGAPQEIILQLVRKGEEWAPEGGDVPMDYAHAHDAIGFETWKDLEYGVLNSKQLIYWDGKRYAEY